MYIPINDRLNAHKPKDLDDIINTRLKIKKLYVFNFPKYVYAL